MRVAVIADIHGNVLALEAVLADIKRRGADLTFDLGDCVGGPLWPRETYDRLAALNLPTVRGNHERQMQAERAALGASDAYAVERLTAAQTRALGALPLTLSPADGILMCHGTPADDATPLLERELPEGGFALAPRPSIMADVEAVDATLLLCGHTHNPRIVHMARPGRAPLTIVNPGSVGLPGFEDNGRYFGCGAPHARYALLTKHRGHWSTEHIALDYDWHGAAKQAAANQRDDWARALATGFAGP